ncbi:hypothetical protein OG194_46330 [Streptomyces sp. NBC_01288]|uniref:hypothetical protein n=1 Tax=Streptomyces sp. NBC_01288 TaxID=2903814 RepID=UPI002E115B35|nr:hypothetical protein OG194_46330 [Streptomyces sp. NBC_01288]
MARARVLIQQVISGPELFETGVVRATPYESDPGRALDALGTTTAIEPAQVAERLFHTAYDGVAKPIRFVQGTTHALDPENTGFLYQVRDGAFRFLGRYDQVGAVRP